jgi:hypothetical protein
MGELPISKDEPKSLHKRVKKLTEGWKARHGHSMQGPEALIRVTCQCLDPEPNKRPTALQILSLALKSDLSEIGLRRSESFWKALTTLPRDSNGIAAETVRHFISEYLRLIDDAPFTAVEVCYILSLQSIFMPSDLFSTADIFRDRLCGGLQGTSIYHAVAIATSRDPYLRKLVWEDCAWPKVPQLQKLSLRKDKKGNLPSTVAMMEMNLSVCKALSEIE